MLPGTSAGSRGSPKHCDNTAADYFVSAFSENRALSAEQEETSLANADQVSTPRRVARRAGGRTACFRTVPQHGASSQLRPIADILDAANIKVTSARAFDLRQAERTAAELCDQRI
jgi:hypothetical protein